MNEAQKPSVDTALADEIAHLSLTIRQQSSWSHRFLLGVVQGVGTVLGATVVVGILLYVLTGIAHQIPWGDVLTQFLTRAATAR